MLLELALEVLGELDGLGAVGRPSESAMLRVPAGWRSWTGGKIEAAERRSLRYGRRARQEKVDPIVAPDDGTRVISA